MDIIQKNKTFREWVERYYDYGYRLAFRIIAGEEEARDLVQDAFLRVWEHYDQFRPEMKFTTWFFRIVVNLCYDKLRKIKMHNLYIEAWINEFSDNTPDPEKDHSNKNMAEIIRTLSGELSPRQRIIFVLRDLEDLEMEEICGITGMRADQVKANLYHARKKIREKLIQLKTMEEKI